MFGSAPLQKNLCQTEGNFYFIKHILAYSTHTLQKMDKRQIWGGGGRGAISKLASVFNRCQVGKQGGNEGGGGGGGGYGLS